MLVECGLVRVTAGDGAEFTFAPSFGRLAALASPEGLVELYASLHGPKAEAAAADVLAGLCDPACTESLPALIGEPEDHPQGIQWTGGAMPPHERVIIARHLMQHGKVDIVIVGTDRTTVNGDVANKIGTYLKALADKDWTKRMASQGIHLLPEAQYAPEAFAKHTAAEVERWRKVATDAKIQID